MKKYLVLFVTTFAFIFFGCDSGGSMTDKKVSEVKPTDSTGIVSFTLKNTGSAKYPGTPDKVVVRLFGPNDVKVVDFPDKGEETNVSVQVADGVSSYVGIMAYQSNNGEVSFVAFTDDKYTVTAGQTTNIDLSTSTNNLNSLTVFDISKDVWESGQSVYVKSRGLQNWNDNQENNGLITDEDYVCESSFSSNLESLFYYSSDKSFQIGDSNVKVIDSYEEDSENGYVSYDEGCRYIFTLNDNTASSLYARVRHDVGDGWGTDPELFITRPHPSKPAFDVLSLTGDINVSFEK